MQLSSSTSSSSDEELTEWCAACNRRYSKYYYNYQHQLSHKHQKNTKNQIKKIGHEPKDEDQEKLFNDLFGNVIKTISQPIDIPGAIAQPSNNSVKSCKNAKDDQTTHVSD